MITFLCGQPPRHLPRLGGIALAGFGNGSTPGAQFVGCALALIVAAGCGRPDGPSKNAIAELLGIAGLEGVTIGMPLSELKQVRGALQARSYGNYEDALPGHRIRYRVDGFAPNEGADAPPWSPLESVTVTPLAQGVTARTWVDRVTSKLGNPEACFSVREGERGESVYTVWEDETVAVVDATLRSSYGGGRFGPYARTITISVGSLIVFSSEAHNPRTEADCPSRSM